MQGNPNEPHGQHAPNNQDPAQQNALDPPVVFSNEQLLATFRSYDPWRQNIVWMYFLHLHTDGALGANPDKAGSMSHYKVSSTITEAMTIDQFKYRAKQVRHVARLMQAGMFTILYCILLSP